MKLPPGVTFHFACRVYGAGDEIPPELEARLPEEVRIAAGARVTPAAKAHARVIAETVQEQGK